MSKFFDAKILGMCLEYGECSINKSQILSLLMEAWGAAVHGVSKIQT